MNQVLHSGGDNALPLLCHDWANGVTLDCVELSSIVQHKFKRGRKRGYSVREGPMTALGYL